MKNEKEEGDVDFGGGDRCYCQQVRHYHGRCVPFLLVSGEKERLCSISWGPYSETDGAQQDASTTYRCLLSFLAKRRP